MSLEHNIISAERGVNRLGHKPIPFSFEYMCAGTMVGIYRDYIHKIWKCQHCKQVYMLFKSPNSEHIIKHVETFFVTQMFIVTPHRVYGKKFLKENRAFLCQRLKNLL